MGARLRRRAARGPCLGRRRSHPRRGRQSPHRLPRECHRMGSRGAAAAGGDGVPLECSSLQPAPLTMPWTAGSISGQNAGTPLPSSAKDMTALIAVSCEQCRRDNKREGKGASTSLSELPTDLASHLDIYHGLALIDSLDELDRRGSGPQERRDDPREVGRESRCANRAAQAHDCLDNVRKRAVAPRDLTVLRVGGVKEKERILACSRLPALTSKATRASRSVRASAPATSCPAAAHSMP